MAQKRWHCLEDWVTQGHAVRDVAGQVPELAALLPHVDQAHAVIVAAQPIDLIDARNRLTEAIRRKDLRFDHLARSVSALMDGYIGLALVDDDSARAHELRSP